MPSSDKAGEAAAAGAAAADPVKKPRKKRKTKKALPVQNDNSRWEIKYEELEFKKECAFQNSPVLLVCLGVCVIGYWCLALVEL